MSDTRAMREKQAMSEAEVQARIMLGLGRRPDLRLFRNTVGEGWHGEAEQVRGRRDVILLHNPRRVTFGLCPDSSDLIGWQSVIITCDMIGETIARFVGWEVKTDTGRPSKGQLNFAAVVNAAGGRAGVVRSLADAESLLA